MRGAGAVRVPTARLFVGLRPAPEDRARLAGWATGALTPLDERLRLVDETALHVTLVFLGAVPLERVPEAVDRTLSLGARDRAAVLEPVSMRAFGTAIALVLRPDPDSTWVDVARGLLAADLVAAGLARAEERAWTPHLTLARVPARRRPRAPLPAPPEGPVRHEGVSLYRSVTERGRTTYVRLDA